MQPVRHRASFRDPEGFIFREGDSLYRLIQGRGVENFNRLVASGLYDKLAGNGSLISHTDVSADFPQYRDAVVIRPELVTHISYPYEWSFSALKDAAVLTLDICTAAIEHGMILKDASAYNVQFAGGRPVFIDTGSFEQYEEGLPWSGYRQFCQHFLAPLLLASKLIFALPDYWKPGSTGYHWIWRANCCPGEPGFPGRF